jgi:hypothetical protein
MGILRTAKAFEVFRLSLSDMAGLGAKATRAKRLSQWHALHTQLGLGCGASPYSFFGCGGESTPLL